ncbi:MAG: OFA family MFS transporter [Clostridiales bacterium]|nr:OFA family MFS transporter [Clostridiales bacterium]
MKNRWIYAFAGVVIMLFAGLIYGWSVFRAPMAADFPDWSVFAFALNFSLCMSFFCIGTLCGGLLSRKTSPKQILTAAAFMIFIGFLITSKTSAPIMLYVGYGIISGFAIGLVYNCVISTTLKWFPGRSGLMSGVLLMGFGFSALWTGPVFTRIAQSYNWNTAFFVFGILTAAIFLAGAAILRNPETLTQAKDSTDKSQTSEIADFSPGEMLKTGRFWSYFLWTAVLSAGGLAISAHSYDMAYEVLIADKLFSSTLDTVAASLPILVALFSVFNGLGRVLFGAFFDKVGRKKTMNTVCLVYILATVILFFAISQSFFPLLIAGLICCGLCYGGIMPSNSSFVRSSFGEKHYSVNFSIITLNLLPASYLGPLVSGALFDATGSYIGNVICLGCLSAAGILLAFMVTKTEKP